MSTACILWAIGALTAFSGSIEGTVTRSNGDPVPNAQVFLEPGLGYDVIQTTSDATGHFSFDGIRPGQCGVFAIAEGLAWGGLHIPLALDERVDGITIHLAQPATIRGTVENAQGDPVTGAQISRIALVGNTKVAIPLAKLLNHGIAAVMSDAKGKFSLDNVPKGETLALKVGHGLYAQEGVQNVEAGARAVTVVLHRGVLLTGEVFSREEQLPVANAAVLIRNAQPPHETITTRTNGRGAFDVRLKPGVYMYSGASGMSQSAGWKQLVITPESISPTLRLNVSGTGAIQGEVRDAITGKPIEGVRLALDTGGTRSAITRTGPKGTFQFTTVLGENVVQILDAAGYDATATKGLNVFVETGKVVELPGLWLKPVPAFDVSVSDASGNKVAHAKFQFLSPPNIPTQQADAQGQAHIEPTIIPESGRVIGQVHHPVKAEGAIFELPRSATGTTQQIQLLPFSAVQGQVVDENNTPLSNVLVNAILADGIDDVPIVLWSLRTDAEGRFYYDTLVPGVPHACVVYLDDGQQIVIEPFNTAPGTLKELGVIKETAPVVAKSQE